MLTGVSGEALHEALRNLKRGYPFIAMLPVLSAGAHVNSRAVSVPAPAAASPMILYPTYSFGCGARTAAITLDRRLVLGTGLPSQGYRLRLSPVVLLVLGSAV